MTNKFRIKSGFIESPFFWTLFIPTRRVRGLPNNLNLENMATVISPRWATWLQTNVITIVVIVLKLRAMSQLTADNLLMNSWSFRPTRWSWGAPVCHHGWRKDGPLSFPWYSLGDLQSRENHNYFKHVGESVQTYAYRNSNCSTYPF